MPMPYCNCCAGLGAKDEEGVLCGKVTKLDDDLQMPLIKIFEERIRKGKISGKKPAVHFSERAMLTYSQLNALASCLAKNIVDRLGFDYKTENPDQDIVIAMCLPMSEKSVALILAILKTGAAYLPLDPHFPEDLLIQIVTAFKPILLITDDNGRIFNKYDVDTFSNLCKLCSIEELWLDADFLHEPKTRRASMDKAWDIDVLDTLKDTNINDRPVAIFYAFGLYNNPSGVRLSNQSIINLISSNVASFKSAAKDVCCVTVSTASPISIPQIFIPLLLGCTLHLFRRSEVTNMDNFVKMVSWRDITKLSIPTYYLNDFLDSIEFLGKEVILKSLRKLKFIICRGGFISLEKAKWFFAIFSHGVKLGNCPGTIETTGEIALEVYTSLKDYKSKLVTGRPGLTKILDNVRIYILDENLQIVRDGSQGEICVSGKCLAMGYVNDSPKGGQGEGTNFLKNPHPAPPGFDRIFRTGEYGRIQKTNRGKRMLYLEGRHDTYVKVRTHIFSTQEVSEFLKDFACVEDAYVFVHHAGKRDQEIIGFVSLNKDIKPENVPTPVEFIFTLRDYLPYWAVPDEIKIIKKVPIHGIEKKCRLCPHCLIQLFRKDREPSGMEWDQVKLPEKDQDVAKTLIRAMFKYCSVPISTVHGNMNRSFYELGGTSLNSMAVLMFLNENGYAINIKHLLDSVNLYEVIAAMSKHRQAAPQDNLPLGILRPEFYMSVDTKDGHIVTDITTKYKDSIIQMLSLAYAHKDEFQDYDLVSIPSFQKYFQDTWPLYVEKQDMSIMALKNNSEKSLLGALLAYDFFTNIDKSSPVLEMIHEIKGNCVEYVPHYMNETLEICWMGTVESLYAQENIRIVTLMLHAIIVRAKEREYSGIFLVVHNQLVRDICIGVFGFVLLDDYQANRYVDRNGKRPYHLANDTVAAAVCVLTLREFKEPQNPDLKVDPADVFPNLKGTFSFPVYGKGDMAHRRIMELKNYPNSKILPLESN